MSAGRQLEKIQLLVPVVAIILNFEAVFAPDLCGLVACQTNLLDNNLVAACSTLLAVKELCDGQFGHGYRIVLLFFYMY